MDLRDEDRGGCLHADIEEPEILVLEVLDLLVVLGLDFQNERGQRRKDVPRRKISVDEILRTTPKDFYFSPQQSSQQMPAPLLSTNSAADNL